MQTILDPILRRFVTFGRLTVGWPDGSQTNYGEETGPTRGDAPARQGNDPQAYR